MREYYNYENLTNVPYHLCLEPYGSLEYGWLADEVGILYQRSFILDPSSWEQPIKQESKPVGKFWWIRRGLSKFRDISIRAIVEQPIWYR